MEGDVADDAWTVEIAGLRKVYADAEALRGLDLRVPRGSIFGLLGRNGAGKTTTLKVLLGMVKPTAGTARVFDLPADEEPSSIAIRQRTAFVADEPDLPEGMTVDDSIRYAASFATHWQAEAARSYQQRFGLEGRRRVRGLSRGTRAKLALLLALSRSADLLVLDEPTSSLDPSAREDVLGAVVSYAAMSGAAVLFSSHQIGDVEQIADHVAFIDRGRTIDQGALDDLRERYCRVQVVFDREAPAADIPGALQIDRRGRVLSVVARSGAEAVIERVRALNPSSVDAVPLTLREMFLAHGAGED